MKMRAIVYTIAVMTEHFRVHKELDNSEWIVFSQMIEDPQYLTQPYIVTYHFKKLPNGSSWTPCLAPPDRFLSVDERIIPYDR